MKQHRAECHRCGKRFPIREGTSNLVECNDPDCPCHPHTYETLKHICRDRKACDHRAACNQAAEDALSAAIAKDRELGERSEREYDARLKELTAGLAYTDEGVSGRRQWSAGLVELEVVAGAYSYQSRDFSKRARGHRVLETPYRSTQRRLTRCTVDGRTCYLEVAAFTSDGYPDYTRLYGPPDVIEAALTLGAEKQRQWEAELEEDRKHPERFIHGAAQCIASDDPRLKEK